MPRWRNSFTLADFAVTDKAVVAGQYNKLGEYIVKAKQVLSVGFGAQAGMDNAVGRIFGKFFDNSGTPVEITGKVRLSIYSPQDQPKKIIWELPTQALNTVSTDRTKQTPLPMSIEDVTEDMKLVLEIKPDAAKTLAVANSALIMDMTDGSTV